MLSLVYMNIVGGSSGLTIEVETASPEMYLSDDIK